MPTKSQVNILVSVKANLSDGITSVENEFKISYLPVELNENQAPYFQKRPKSLYIIILSDGPVNSIALGKIKDDYNAEVT